MYPTRQYYKKNRKNDVGHVPDTSVLQKKIEKMTWVMYPTRHLYYKKKKNDVGHVPDTSVLQKKNRKNDVGHVPDTSVLQKKIEKMTWVMYPTRQYYKKK